MAFVKLQILGTPDIFEGGETIKLVNSRNLIDPENFKIKLDLLTIF